MNRTKRMVSLVLIMAVLASMAVTAMAAGTNSITVRKVEKGETYSIYKILDLSVNNDISAYTYTVNSAWKTFFVGEGAGAAYVNIAASGAVTWKEGKNTDVEMVAFAKAAAEFAKAKNITTAADPIVAPEDGEITFGGLESGYYLITSTLGTVAMT